MAVGFTGEEPLDFIPRTGRHDCVVGLRDMAAMACRDQGEVWGKNGFVTRESNEVGFDASVLFYWIALGFGIVMLFVVTIATIKQISH